MFFFFLPIIIFLFIVIWFHISHFSVKKMYAKNGIVYLERALEKYYEKHHRYVTREEGLTLLYKKGYIKREGLKCPYRMPWDYKSVSKAGSPAQKYYLRSVGPDGKPETKDDINSENHPWPSAK